MGLLGGGGFGGGEGLVGGRGFAKGNRGKAAEDVEKAGVEGNLTEANEARFVLGITTSGFRTFRVGLGRREGFEGDGGKSTSKSSSSSETTLRRIVEGIGDSEVRFRLRNFLAVCSPPGTHRLACR